MTTQVKQNDPKQPTLSEKALRLLAAHDREIQSFDTMLATGRTANRWG